MAHEGRRSGSRRAAGRDPSPPRVVDLLVESLAERGVRYVFGVGGANIEDLFDALDHTGRSITGILAKHEFSAATMADCHARTSGGLGVVAATSGGGATNLVPALAEAYASRVPVLALVGQPPATLSGTGAFQDTSGAAGAFDAARLFAPISRFCTRAADPASVPELVDRSIDAALGRDGGPGGPAVLLLPKDIQQATVMPVTPRRVGSSDPVDHGARSRAADVLSSARDGAGGVLVIAGDGVARADARAELGRLATALNAAVAVAPDAKDVFDNGHRRFVGVCGVMGHPAVAARARQAAAIVLVGTRLPMVARDGLDRYLAGTPVVCLDSEPPFIECAVHLPGRLRRDLAALVELLEPSPPNTGRPTPRLGPPELLPMPAHTGPGLGYREAMGAIEKAIPDAASVVVDAGNTGAAAIHQLPAPTGGRFVVALGMGGMGYSFGAGIGAAAATGARTYVIAGDGAFYMHGMEIHTAVEYDLPVTFIVFNNNAHAMCVTRETLYFDGNYTYNRFGPTHLAAGVAAMFPTLPARHVETADELLAALTDANPTNSPAFVSVACDPDEVPPFLPFLTTRGAPP
ncbi:thiamine pyrophosphate-binding protein [Rhodococcus sp. WS4]|nr:thiamine pyrophosphate-binding protein [Rhodococcus sp. WS4]